MLVDGFLEGMSGLGDWICDGAGNVLIMVGVRLLGRCVEVREIWVGNGIVAMFLVKNF